MYRKITDRLPVLPSPSREDKRDKSESVEPFGPDTEAPSGFDPSAGFEEKQKTSFEGFTPQSGGFPEGFGRQETLKDELKRFKDDLKGKPKINRPTSRRR